MPLWGEGIQWFMVLLSMIFSMINHAMEFKYDFERIEWKELVHTHSVWVPFPWGQNSTVSQFTVPPLLVSPIKVIKVIDGMSNIQEERRNKLNETLLKGREIAVYEIRTVNSGITPRSWYRSELDVQSFTYQQKSQLLEHESSRVEYKMRSLVLFV